MHTFVEHVVARLAEAMAEQPIAPASAGEVPPEVDLIPVGPIEGSYRLQCLRLCRRSNDWNGRVRLPSCQDPWVDETPPFRQP